MLNHITATLDYRIIVGAAVILLAGMMLVQANDPRRIADVLQYWLLFPLAAI